MASVDVDALTTLSSVSDYILRSDRSDSLTDKVFKDNAQFESEGIRSIHSASDRVKDYLNRSIHIQKYEPLLKVDDWVWAERTPDSNYPYKLRLNMIDDWPILKVSEDVKFHPNRDRHIFAQKTHEQITFWAGYRRSEQDLSDLSLTNEFNDKKDIPTIDGSVIQDVVNALALYWSTLRVRGLIATSSMTQEMGDFQTSLQSENFDDSFESKQLNRISPKRYMVS